MKKYVQMRFRSAYSMKFLLILIFTFALGLVAAPAQAETVGPFYIKHESSGRYIHPGGGTVVASARAVLFDGAVHRFFFEYVDGNMGYIISEADPNLNLVPYGGGTNPDNGTDLTFWPQRDRAGLFFFDGKTFRHYGNSYLHPLGGEMVPGNNARTVFWDSMTEYAKYVPVDQNGQLVKMRVGRFKASSINTAELPAAIERYAPKLYFHKNEAYLPCSMEDFFAKTEATTDDDGKNARRIKDPSLKSGNPDGANAYVNVILGPSTTDIQYWFLYGYNGPGTAYFKIWVPFKPSWTLPWNWEGPHYESLGDRSLGQAGQHEGDWEHITVRIRNDTYEAVEAYYAVHDKSEVKNFYSEPLQNGQVTAYASLNGHASYPTPERHYSFAWTAAKAFEFWLLDDTSAPDKFVDYKNHWVLIGLNDQNGKDYLGATPSISLSDRKPIYFTYYTGRWGAVVLNKIGNPFPAGSLANEGFGALQKELKEFDEEKGPSPPWSKKSWITPEW